MSPGERRLLALPRFAHDAAAYKPGLDRMRALLAALGDPHRAVPSIHVAGTNGKGSTSSLAASVATAAGKRVGLHTSPHLVTLRERMRVDGAPAPDAWLDRAVARLGDAMDEVGPTRQVDAVSFFEATVALSFLYFADRGVDLAVVEVGLGGRLDATNVLVPEAAVVTHVGLDHTDLLGGTVQEIAREKAGIAKPGVPLLHAVTGPARTALQDEAARLGASVEDVRQSCRVEDSFVTPVADHGAVAVGLPGSHQRWNAALAVRAVEVAFGRLGWALPPDAVPHGLAEVGTLAGLRGRSQPWDGDARVILDVAHNADGWQTALDAIRLPDGGRLWALVGVMADKDAGALADALAGRADHVFALSLGGDRALSASGLSEIVETRGTAVTPTADAATALAAFRAACGPDDRMLVTGSHQTVAAVLAGRTPVAAMG